jgi:transcriptional regulator of acetoin/glycerol metabolism
VQAGSGDEVPATATARTADLGDLVQGRPPRFLLATAHGGMQLHALPDAGRAILGRGAECEVVLDFAQISRQHACLHIGDRCVVTDLGSRNGTLVCGERLRRGDARVIGYGDSFSIGPLALLLVAPGASSVAAQPTGARLRIHDIEAEAEAPALSAIARSRLSVLLYGETGAGKEVLAQTIHRLSRRTGPFVAINCAALSESLLETELFGHERGAFTGAVAARPGLVLAAAGGTLLLDEIGEMSPAIQAKLLRAIETHTVLAVGSVRPVAVDVRFLAATHRDLLAEVERGSFRRDLYYRLAGFACEIPPLRERTTQVTRLALQIVAAAAERAGAPPPAITPEASAALVAHDWPGNVRELRNVLERAMLLAAGGSIERGHLLFDTCSARNDERARIVDALEACAGNQTRAARLLAMSRTTMVEKVRLHRIPRPRKPA